MESYKQSRISRTESLVWLALALAAAACGPDANLPDGGLPDGDQQCALLCVTSVDCCPGQGCQGGVCAAQAACASGCNFDCDRAAGQVCNLQTLLCEPGQPPTECIDLCNCYTGERCVAGRCALACEADSDCPEGQVCGAQACQPATCTDRTDCAGDECLVCKGGECTAPAMVCLGNEDCCLGMFCNFGTCTPEAEGCQADSDCPDPLRPRCVDHMCMAVGQACALDIDCPAPGEVCQAGQCVAPGCDPQTCPLGQWCDLATGLCKPGCDSNDDCLAPATCNYASHQCGQADCCGGLCTPGSQVCDPGTCQCREVCLEANDCPADFDCRLADGQCVCTPAACPAGTHCNPATGQCALDQVDCVPAVFSTSIACGAATNGRFESICESTLRAGSYAKQFVFAGTAGDLVTIDLASVDVDTYLYLLGPTGALLASNDDGGLSTDSQISTSLSVAGAYTIEATTRLGGEQGDFSLSLLCSPPSDCVGPITCGQTIQSAWTSQCESPNRYGSYARQYTFVPVPDQLITIDLISPTVDTFLYLILPDGWLADYDDDGGAGSNSRISGTPLVGGTWYIEATTYRSYQTGDFEISLTCH